MERTISVALTPKDLPEVSHLGDACAVIIDVLRATTVMTTAGHHGASSITTCGEIQAARELASSITPRPLLCGERQCKRIEGFDCGNSPAEYHRQRVGGKPLILTTTNGTAAIDAASASRRMIVASFLNLAAVLNTLRDEASLHIVCAGTEGQVSGEDVLLAGAIVHGIAGPDAEDRLNDSARLARGAWQQVIDRPGPLDDAVAAELKLSHGGRNLIRVGYAEDIDRCATLNTIDGIVERESGTASRFRFIGSD